jgi:hypothetical protein
LFFDGLPLEEIVDRQQAAPARVRVAEGGQPSDGLGLGVDRLMAPVGVLAPVGNQAPAQPVALILSRLRLRRAVVARLWT